MQAPKHYLLILLLSLFVLPQLTNAARQTTKNELAICLDLHIDEQIADNLRQQFQAAFFKNDFEIIWTNTCANTKDGVWVTANYPVVWDNNSKWNKKLDEKSIQFNFTILNSNLMSDISSFLVSQWDQTEYAIEFPSTSSEAFPIIVNSVAGLGLLTLNQCAQAQEHFSKAKSIASKSHLHTYNLEAMIAFYQGNCAIRQKDYETARDFFIQSISLPSERSGPNYAPEMNLVWSYWKLNQTNLALQILNKDIESTRDYLRPFHILKRAEFYIILDRYSDAVNDYNTAIDQIPDQAQLYLERGQTYLLLYQWDNVLADYNKAIELDPTYADAYFYRGVLFYSILQTGQAMYNDALADFNHYLELAPNGEHATDATRYATDIQTQINALNN